MSPPNEQPADLALVGPRVLLRPLQESDVNEEYLAWLNDRAVNRYLAVGQSVSTDETLRAYLQRFQNSRTDVLFVIIHRQTARPLGTVTINRLHPVNRTADTGIMIGRKDSWGRGYGVEAWRLAIEYAFTNLGVRKLTAGAVVDNLASIAALKKLGFKQEGVFREEFLVDGQYRDIVRFGVFQHEFEHAKARE